MSFLTDIKKQLHRYLVNANAPLQRAAERQLVLQALTTAKMNRSLQQLDGLHDAEFCAFSQWGEDGVIDWLIERLPYIPQTFIEFGVEDYRESNTRLLLHLRNWRGLVMDGSADHISDIRSQEIYWRHDLTAKCAFIDRDNINRLIADAGFKGGIGLLSVDIDGNDYWVWKAIDVVSPAIVICEYNAVFGDRYRMTVPYQADFQRTRAHHSNLYFGASLAALIDLAGRKGYTFVGTNSNGCNAFFVRNDHAGDTLRAIGKVRSFPSAIRESRDAFGQLTFASGESRVQAIRHLPVFDCESNVTKPLADFGELYSEEWRRVC